MAFGDVDHGVFFAIFAMGDDEGGVFGLLHGESGIVFSVPPPPPPFFFSLFLFFFLVKKNFSEVDEHAYLRAGRHTCIFSYDRMIE